MLKNYFKIAWRNLRKYPSYSFINVFGLALGMAVTMQIGLWVNTMLSYDGTFKNRDRIAQFWQHQTFENKINSGPAIPRPLEFELRNNYSQYFQHIVMASWTQLHYLEYGEKVISQTGNYAQPDILEMLDIEVLQGEKNGLREIKSIMLAESLAKNLFGKEDPIGRIVNVSDRTDLKVTAVFRDFPHNSSFFETYFFIPWDQYVAERSWVQNSLDSWGNNSFQLFVQVAEGQTVENVSHSISKVKYDAAGETYQVYNPTLELLSMKDWYLRNLFKEGKRAGGRIYLVWLFGIIGLFVLVLACINFMNLSTARSEKRAKEVGIRKSIGSVRSQLIFQFLSESVLVVFMAFVLAVVLVISTLPSFNELAETKIAFPWKNATFWLLCLGFIALTAFVSGSYPALYLSSFEPVKILKGTFKAGRFSALPRKVLVVLQFSISLALIIGTAIVLQQINFTKNRPIGYETDGLIQIPVMSNVFIGKAEFMRNQFLASGAVEEMACSSSPSTEIYSNRAGFLWDGKPDNFQEDFAWTEVSHEYMKTMGAKIIAGRDFSREMKTDTHAVLVNASFVKYIGKTMDNIIGLQIRYDREEPGQPLTVIGVVEDILVQSPYEPVKQGVYAFNAENNESHLTLRLNRQNSTSMNMATIEAVFKKYFPQMPFEYQFIEEEYGKKFALEERIAKLGSVFTFLAIFISCLGIFGLASFVAEQRTKEVGLRKVMGASITNLWAMLSKDFVLLVIVAFVLASPLTWWGMDLFLDRYTYKTSIAWWVFILAGVCALLVTLLTVSYQAIKAATLNPVKSLRSE